MLRDPQVAQGIPKPYQLADRGPPAYTYDLRFNRDWRLNVWVLIVAIFRDNPSP